MPDAKLRQTLEALEEQLASTDALDPQEAELLEQVSDRIERLLELTQESRIEEAPRVQHVVGGTLERFEARHPELARLLDALATTLSSLGI